MAYNVRVYAIVLIPPNWENKNNCLYFYFTYNIGSFAKIFNMTLNFDTRFIKAYNGHGISGGLQLHTWHNISRGAC